jgi:leader peptidase (prepilin peptidase) / N-methyltransferase
MVITALVLAWVGLCFGSFAGALAWRLRAKKDWVKARSQCEHCGHQLAAADLVPLFSWLALRGRCRYCHSPIGWQTLLIEVGGGLAFALSYIFWPQPLQGGQWVLFVTWLAASVGLLALLVYDLRWMLLPNKLVYPTATIAATGRLVYLAGFEEHKLHALIWWVLSVAVASGLFLVLFIISQGKWIGFGDVRLGYITGTILSNPAHSFLMIFLAAVLGTVFMAPSVLAHHKKMTSKLPFGPFLIVSSALVLLFGPAIINWYNRLLN